MSIPKIVKIKNDNLPDNPGVYLMKDASGEIIYVGKAGSLKRRVSSYYVGLSTARQSARTEADRMYVGGADSSHKKPAPTSRGNPRDRAYFLKAHDNRISRLVSEIRVIDYLETPTVIEALILESGLIKKYAPKFNIKDKDNKSFLYVVITKEDYPRVLLVRGTELKKIKSARIFGPFVSASSIRAALKILRRIFPWNSHSPSEIRKLKRPCFNYQIGLCPGTCLGAISKKDYARIIKNLILFLAGKKIRIIRNLKLELSKLSRLQRFEAAAKVRDMIFNLEHIYDTALIVRENPPLSPFAKGDGDSLPFAKGEPERDFINIFGRIEGYDISNISGASAVGSMVVFVSGHPEKSEYRKFKIKTIKGANDVGMLKEILRRRFKNNWPHPDIILIDGGWGQVNAAGEILKEFNLKISVLGIAKGITRKKDELVFGNVETQNFASLRKAIEQSKDIFVAVRDEAHRFAIGYHRKLRGKLN